MRSLRYRLLLSILLTVGILWLGIAPWLYITIKTNVNQVLDDRLAASANMLAKLMQEYDLNNIEQSSTSTVLEKLTQNTTFPETIACRVTRLDGSVLVSSGDSGQDVLVSANDGYSFVTDANTVWRVFQLSRDNFTVTTAEKTDKRKQLLNLILIGVVVPLIFAVFMMLVTTFFVINQVFKPLTRLQNQFAARSGSTLSPIELQQVPMEVKEVVTEFNSLLSRVQRVIDNERRFTADAAHELRTPLAGISTQLQVAMLKSDRSVGDSLRKAEVALKQLSQMLNQLLMLARLDSNQMASVSSSTDAATITESALSPLKEIAEAKQVEVKTTVSTQTQLHLPVELVSLALRNVIKNAIQFSAPGQRVTISVVEKGMITWEVEDRAGGVPDELLPSITQRFVHDKRKGNFGLGLSITHSIATVLDGELSFENIPGGLRVRLSFPCFCNFKS